MPLRSAAPPRARIVLAFACIYLCWGATFLAIRYVVAEVPPLLTVSVRCATGALLLGLWARWRGARARTTAAEWRVACVAGLLLFVGCEGTLIWAEQRVTSGQAAVMMTAIPVWLVVLDAVRRGARPSPRAGLALGFGTLGVLVLTAGGRWSGGLPELVALVGSAFSWAAGSLVARDGARPEDATLACSMQLAAGAGWALVASLLGGELTGWHPGEVTARGAAALGFLTLGGTVLAFGAYTWLLRVSSPLAVGTYAFVNPVVALLLAWGTGDERPSARTAVSMLLVFGAVAAAQWPSPRTRPVSDRDRAWAGRARPAPRRAVRG